MEETIRNKHKTNIWKERLQEVQKEKKALQRINKRLETQSLANKAEKEALKKALKKAESKQIKVGKEVLGGDKPYRHKYPSSLLYLAIYYQAIVGLSYRQVRLVILRLKVMLDLEMSVPSASSVRNWVRKAAYYELKRGKSIEWGQSILIIDESAGIGQEKMLLILRIKAEKVKKGSSLGFGDVEVLSVKSGKSWTGEQIATEIGILKKRLNLEIKYVLSDRCSNLLKSCKVGGYRHVNDCTHQQASYLEGYYSKAEDFQELMKRVGKIRQKWVNSKNSALIAPNMRTKSRFLNLFEIVEWMRKILSAWEKLDTEVRIELAFLHQYDSLIKELVCMLNLIKDLSAEFKTQGIDKNTQARVQVIFDKANSKCPNILDFNLKIKAYIDNMRTDFDENDTILCCSDVIESLFGKFKNRNQQGTTQGITDDMMVMTLFNGDFNQEQIFQAMEKVKLADIDVWTKENTVPSFAKTKNDYWRNLGTNN